MKEPGTGERGEWRASLAWGLAAAVAAVGCAILWSRMAWGNEMHPRPPTLSQGMFTGIFVGAIAGARTRRLAGWILGPLLGAGVGWFDLACLEQFLGCDRLSYFAAATIPIWGLAGALLLTITRRRWSTVAIVTFVAAGTDLLARWCLPWITPPGSDPFPRCSAPDLLVYAPTSFVLVFFARWRMEVAPASDAGGTLLDWFRDRPAVWLLAAIPGGFGIFLWAPDWDPSWPTNEDGESWSGPSRPTLELGVGYEEANEIISGEFAKAGYAVRTEYCYPRIVSQSNHDSYRTEFDRTAKVGFVLLDDEHPELSAALDREEIITLGKLATLGFEFVLVIPVRTDPNLSERTISKWQRGARVPTGKWLADPVRRYTVARAPCEAVRDARRDLARLVRPWLARVQSRRR